MEAVLKTDRILGAEVADAPPDAATLCVHFTSGRADHAIWLAEPDEPPAQAISRASVVWRDLPGPVLHGRVIFGRGATCDCFLLLGGDARLELDALRQLGLSRSQASLLVRMRQRPLLVTAARAGEAEPGLVRRLHRLLLSTVSRYVVRC